MNNNNKAVIYARVSTDEQTIENQMKVLEQWAKDRDLEIVGSYEDTGSAFAGQDRMALIRLKNDARLGKFKRVLIYSVDRLTRRGILDMFNIIKGLQKYDVQIMSYTQQWLDPESGFYEMMLAQFAFFANMESRIISERTKAGMERARQQGKHVGRPRIKK